MKQRLKILIDKIYELEGLVSLAIKRDDISDELSKLISQKGNEVNNLCKAFSEGNLLKSTTSDSSNYFIDEYSLNDEAEESENLIGDGKENIEKKSRPEGKLVFTINDRFRFKKELFNNSDVDFNNTMALIASMEDYEEARDYFFNEEGFSNSDPVVIEFLEIIKRYFK